jgi:hypothetical protein
VGCWTDSIFIYFRFTHALTSLIGNVMRVETQSYSEYEGIFKCFSGKCEMVLELAHKVIIDLTLSGFGSSKIPYRYLNPFQELKCCRQCCGSGSGRIKIILLDPDSIQLKVKLNFTYF